MRTARRASWARSPGRPCGRRRRTGRVASGEERRVEGAGRNVGRADLPQRAAQRGVRQVAEPQVDVLGDRRRPLDRGRGQPDDQELHALLHQRLEEPSSLSVRAAVRPRIRLRRRRSAGAASSNQRACQMLSKEDRGWRAWIARASDSRRGRALLGARRGLLRATQAATRPGRFRALGRCAGPPRAPREVVEGVTADPGASQDLAHREPALAGQPSKEPSAARAS